MKLKSYRKLILPMAIAILLVFIPIQSNAVTKCNSTYDIQKSSCQNTLVIRPNNSYYVVAKNQNLPGNSYLTVAKGQNLPGNRYYIIVGKQNQTTGNYYTIPGNSYSGSTPEPQPVPRPEPQPTPRPEPQPTPRPEPISRPEPKPAPQPEPGTVPDTGDISNERHSLTSEEIQMVDYVNKARQDAGLKPLQIDADLAHIARLKSQDMYANNYFSHDSPTYGSPFDMMTKFGIKYSGAAENIAKNSSVFAAHNAFMRSQGHKDNILNPIYTHIGVGIHQGYYTQMFIKK